MITPPENHPKVRPTTALPAEAAAEPEEYEDLDTDVRIPSHEVPHSDSSKEAAPSWRQPRGWESIG